MLVGFEILQELVVILDLLLELNELISGLWDQVLRFLVLVKLRGGVEELELVDQLIIIDQLILVVLNNLSLGL